MREDPQIAFETWARGHGGLNLVKRDDMENEKLPFPCTYWAYATEIAWRAWANALRDQDLLS